MDPKHEKSISSSASVVAFVNNNETNSGVTKHGD